MLVPCVCLCVGMVCKFSVIIKCDVLLTQFVQSKRDKKGNTTNAYILWLDLVIVIAVNTTFDDINWTLIFVPFFSFVFVHMSVVHIPSRISVTFQRIFVSFLVYEIKISIVRHSFCLLLPLQYFYLLKGKKVFLIKRIFEIIMGGLVVI